MNPRLTLATLTLSAAGLVGLLGWESYSGRAYIPVPGDVPTLGFGTTDGVKMGDTTTPPEALARAHRDITRFEGALRACIHAPLAPHEYDAYVSLAYNIGPAAFCRSTLVRRLNALDYSGACAEILRWKRFQGRDCSQPRSGCAGLWKRRQAEHRQCLGADA